MLFDNHDRSFIFFSIFYDLFQGLLGTSNFESFMLHNCGAGALWLKLILNISLNINFFK